MRYFVSDSRAILISLVFPFISLPTVNLFHWKLCFCNRRNKMTINDITVRKKGTASSLHKKQPSIGGLSLSGGKP